LLPGLGWVGSLTTLSFEEAQQVVAELQRRQKIRDGLVDPKFEAQRRFIQDRSSRFKAAKCTRRAGKTEGLGRDLCLDAMAHPNSPTLYLNATRDECKYVMFEPVLKALNERLVLGGIPNEAELSIKFPNGSYVRCFGVDAKPDEMKKVLGAKYRKVVIDEAAKLRIDLRKLVYEMLFPATSDLRGQIVLAGTADDLTSGLFYDVTRQDGRPREPGWSVHEWSALDNPYMREQFQEDMELLKRTKPGIELTPSYRRMFLNEWVIDTDRLVYKFNRERNYIDALPGVAGDYTYHLGVDLGYDDDSAFVVAAYRDDSKVLYLLDQYKQKGMDVTAVAERINHYRRKYPLGHIIVDGANKQAVEEIKNRHQIPLIAADKQGKADFIEIMNSEFLTGSIKLVGEESKILAEEYGNLIWDEKKLPKKEEHSACANHCADSSLYVWRKCYNYLYTAPVKAPKKTDEEKMLAQEQEREERFTRKQDFVPYWMRERA
jgi:hypothetical protein